MPQPASADVVVVGAGVVGAACALFAARAGLRVAVVDQGSVAGGTTGAGEGNLLVSDKTPGPELDLALRSLALWRELASTMDAEAIELDAKGGLVVAATAAGLRALRELGHAQRGCGVEVRDITADDLPAYEPGLAGDLAGAAFYPQDMQVQPMLAAAVMVRAALSQHGATFHPGATVTHIERAPAGHVVAVRTPAGRIATPMVVNAAGTWAAQVAALAGADLPIMPRRGFILVTQPLPATAIQHKVYSADYVANVASSASDLQTSAVVESTRAGTVLIGASRERVGFDRTFSLEVLARLAAQAVRLFPFLTGVQVIRAYCGFRPYSPDHLPVIGPDARVPGLLHACGHEGAGIGLAPATGELIAAALTGAEPGDLARAFAPQRFDVVEVADA